MPPARRLIAALAGLGLLGLFSVAMMPSRADAADISVNVQVDAPPPPPRHEIVVEANRPGPDYVWVDGFWDGTPGHYVWQAGHWIVRPAAESSGSHRIGNVATTATITRSAANGAKAPNTPNE